MNRHAMSAGALCAAMLLTLGGCGGGEKGKSAGAAGAGGVRPPAAVEAILLGTAPFEEAVEATGTLAARRDAEVKSELAGSVERVFVTEWDRVKKGTPLAKVDTREAEAMVKRAEAGEAAAKASVLEAGAALSRARRERERTAKLQESGLATRQAVEDAATQVEASEARVTAAKAQAEAVREEVGQASTRLSKAVIRAPFDGVVAARLLNPGEVVGDMQKVVFRVVDNRLLDLEMSVPSSEMGRLREGQPVSFSVDSFPGRSFAGKVRRINPVVGGADRAVKVSAEVRNEPEILRTGLFARARILLGSRKGVVFLPRSALLWWDTPARKGELFVLEGSVARKRAVETGVVQGDMVELRSGVKAGDRVVTRGASSLADGDPVTVVGGPSAAPAATPGGAPRGAESKPVPPPAKGAPAKPAAPRKG